MLSPSLHFGAKIRVLSKQFYGNTAAAIELVESNRGSQFFNVNDVPYGSERLFQSVVLTGKDAKGYQVQLDELRQAVNAELGTNSNDTEAIRLFFQRQEALNQSLAAQDNFDAEIHAEAQG